MTQTQTRRTIKRLWALRGALAILNEEENNLTIIGPAKAFTETNLSNPTDIGLDTAIKHGPTIKIEHDGLLKLTWLLTQ